MILQTWYYSSCFNSTSRPSEFYDNNEIIFAGGALAWVMNQK